MYLSIIAIISPIGNKNILSYTMTIKKNIDYVIGIINNNKVIKNNLERSKGKGRKSIRTSHNALYILHFQLGFLCQATFPHLLQDAVICSRHIYWFVVMEYIQMLKVLIKFACLANNSSC